jgi:hypothetical protein
MKNNFCFIIPSFISSDLHGLQLKRCIGSIRRYHNNKIFIVNDYSELDLNKYVNSFDNIEIIQSPVKGAGDMSTYKIFSEMTDFKKAVIMQDSMTVERELEGIDHVRWMKAIWYFTCHRLHWTGIMEPETEYNLENKIRNHDDLILDCIEKFPLKETFKEYVRAIYHTKEKWSGNIGIQSVIDHQFLLDMDEATGIIEFLSHMTDNRLRRVAESVFPLACQYMISSDAFEVGYDGLYYDGINTQNGKDYIPAYVLGFEGYTEIIEQCCKNKYFSKVTFNRRPINL